MILLISLFLNIDSLKLVFALFDAFHWDVFQLDIQDAYLNASFNKDLYATIPKGNINFGWGFRKLNKALYDNK